MSIKIVHNPATGHLNQGLYTKINRKLTRHIDSKKFYIGKTGRDPEVRLKEHLRNNPHWKKMVVLYCSKSKKYVEDLEHELVHSTYKFNKNKTISVQKFF